MNTDVRSWFMVYMCLCFTEHHYKAYTDEHQFSPVQITTVKQVLSGHSKIDKTKVLKPCGSAMQVKTTAECSSGVFCNTFGLH